MIIGVGFGQRFRYTFSHSHIHTQEFFSKKYHIFVAIIDSLFPFQLTGLFTLSPFSQLPETKRGIGGSLPSIDACFLPELPDKCLLSMQFILTTLATLYIIL